MEEISTIYRSDLPPLLTHIPDPPSKLHIQGNVKPLYDINTKILCVIGARAYSTYGKEVTEKLIAGLYGYNICIISGLALGIDSIAHITAINAGLCTIAFPGSGLNSDVLHPQTHRHLADQILHRGGALISEFDNSQHGTRWTFPQRNRIMAGISHATLVIECKCPSGTLITSGLATDYNRLVGAVPGSIFSPLSAGPHMLIGKGATPITSSDDLLEFLGFERRKGPVRLSLENDPRFHTLQTQEKRVLIFIERGSTTRDNISRELGIHPSELNSILTILELETFISEENGTVKII